MKRNSLEEQIKKKVAELNIFRISFALEDISNIISTTTSSPSKTSKEEIVNQLNALKVI